MSITLFSYADDRFGRKDGGYRKTQRRFSSILRNHPDIDEVLAFTDADLTQTQWYADHAHLYELDCTVSAGNAQKAFYAVDLLNRYPEGALLLYHDCSPEIWDFSQDYNARSLCGHIALCDRNGGVLIGNYSPQAHIDFPHTHRSMTSPAVLAALDAETFGDHWQWCTSWILMRNSPKTRDLARNWLFLNSISDCCCMVRRREAERRAYPYFIEHRGDQSILSLLMLKRGMRAMECGSKNIFHADASAPLHDGRVDNAMRQVWRTPAEIVANMGG